MDAGLLILALAGAAAGLAASALPGMHVNGLALLVLATAPRWGEPGVAFLLGALAAAPFGFALSATFLGSEDHPAGALAREGRGSEAVALQCWGAFAGLLVALPLAALAQPALAALAPRLSAVVPWLLAAIILGLVVSEPTRPPTRRVLVVVPWPSREVGGVLARDGDAWRVGARRIEDAHGLLDERSIGHRVVLRVEARWKRGPLSRAAGAALALAALALAGGLGLVALRMGAASPVGLPASALTPLLAGLFGAPALIELWRSRDASFPRARLRAPRARIRDLLRPALPAAAASSILGIAPGLSPSHAALLAPRSREPERALVAMGALSGGAVVFAVLAWHVLAKARQGALVAAQVLAPATAWTGGAPPTALLDEAAMLLAAAAAACLAARAASGAFAALLARVRPRRVATSGLALLSMAVALSTGAWGLAVFAAAALVGLAIAHVGVRRGLAMGCILVPVALRAWGVG